MATITARFNGGSSGTSISGTFTPAASDLIFAVIYARNSIDAAPTCTATPGQSFNLSLVNTMQIGSSNQHRIYLFVADGLASASSTTVTFTTIDSATNLILSVNTVTEMPASKVGAAAIRQIGTDAWETGSQTLTVSLSATILGNALFGVQVHDLSNTTNLDLVQPSGWTELTDSDFSGGEFIDGRFQTTCLAAGVGGATSVVWGSVETHVGGLAFEFDPGISFKGAGGGVSTENGLSDLAPACPATVDAGDVLIGHVFWEGTTAAPDTPSGWTLLSGPHVIEATIARQWVFGRIADGTEDGDFISFGAPSDTNQRGARIYSFFGRISGTITELVNGFSHQSHATDPQMPTVETTQRGALAIALVGQNDNNVQVSATGETGGNWIEIAEYTDGALTPGLAIGLQTCTPTADPGIVAGGTVATVNDPCGVIGFQILSEPAAAALTNPLLATLGIFL